MVASMEAAVFNCQCDQLQNWEGCFGAREGKAWKETMPVSGYRTVKLGRKRLCLFQGMVKLRRETCLFQGMVELGRETCLFQGMVKLGSETCLFQGTGR